MKLPNGHNAVIEDSKLRDYCLSPSHPRGKHKARLFAAALGYTLTHVDDLRTALLNAANTAEAIYTRTTEFGTFYSIEFDCDGPICSGRLLSIWTIQNAEIFPRLVTCYPV
ncbi:MAG TPA: hypothetical protein VFE58_07525 [Tepidisphaeraceae bacterium]|jgi:hypothetical protein|nr:hypothetical protein [Tepidisphaeraceae bacterium]